MNEAAPQLVLASTSRARAELLGRLEVPFSVAAPRFDERSADALFASMAPAEFAAHLARRKAFSLRADHPNAYILAADQIAMVDKELLTKPGSIDAAVEQLMRLAGTTHELITAVVLVGPDSADVHETMDSHRLTMRGFSVAEARAYVERHLPLECAGSYRIEDAGIKLFERIEGDDYTGIIGLPLLAVARLLRQVGLLP